MTDYGLEDSFPTLETVNSTYLLNNDSLLFDNDTFISPSVRNDNAVALGYCGTSLKSFEKSYRSIHGYTSLIVCLLGAQANILNLIVLTRREMINPTNAILTGLALADLLNMLEYIPYAFYMILTGSKNSYAWALFVLIHSNFSQVCHTISIWLTVTLAVWRYVMVAMHVRSKTLCSMERAKWAVFSAYVTSPLLCIPIYLSFSITPFTMLSAAANAANDTIINNGSNVTSTNYINGNDVLNWTNSSTFPTNSTKSETNGGGDTKYIVNLSSLAKSKPLLMTANFWLYSVVIKIIPCILLTIVSFRLINSLMEAKKRKDMLLRKRTTAQAAVRSHLNPGTGGGNSNSDGESSGSDRTTKMLLAVLLLFLITEFPQGLLGLLSGLLGDAFFKSCYIPLADLMDFVALLNSAINFILYCSMSKKFRETFTKIFHLNNLIKLERQEEVQSTTTNTTVPAHHLHSSMSRVATPLGSDRIGTTSNQHILLNQQSNQDGEISAL